MHNNLYEKYQANQYQVDDPINPLIYILRKAEIAKSLTSSEWIWLKKNGLESTITIIQNQEDFRSQIINEIRDELKDLSGKWKTIFPRFSFGVVANRYSETDFLLYRINRFEDISDCNNEDIKHVYKPIYETHKLKKLLSITEELPINSNTYQKLYGMVGNNYSLSLSDLQWLVEFNLHSVIDFLSILITNLFNEFGLSLQSTQKENVLYLSLILQKLKEKLVLSQDEIQYLQRHKMAEVLVVAQRIEFSMLKGKFKAASFPDESPNSHLYKVLKKLDVSLDLSEPDINFLKNRKLNETLKIVYEAEADKLIKKIKLGHELSPDDIAWCKEHDFEEIIFLWLKKDFKINNRTDKPDSKLFSILLKLKDDKRLNDEEIVWLESEELLKPSTLIYKTHHRLEAEFSEAEFNRTKGYWHLVNASAHWRKAENPYRALDKTNHVDIKSIKPAKLCSALLTTRGGAFRDIGHLNEAEECALNAINYFPDSHNPYTLMGALCYDTKRYEEGRCWFEEAIKRGATAQDEDVEIKRILRKKNDPDLIAYLLKRDPHRFAWVKEYLKPKKNKP